MIRRIFSFFSTLESRTYYVFTFLILVTILSTQLISYQFTQRSLTDATNAQKGYAMERLVHQIDSYMLTMENIAQTVIRDEGVQQYFSSQEANPELKEDISEYLASFLRAREDITTIALLGPSAKEVTSSPELEISPYAQVRSQEWYREALDSPGRTYISSAKVQNLFYGIYPWVVSMSTALRDQSSGELLGVLLVDLNFNRIRELSEPVMQDPPEYIFILDKNGDYVFHPKQQLVFSGIIHEPTEEILNMEDHDTPLEIDGRSYIGRTSSYAGWKIVCVTELYAGIDQWRYVQVSYASIGLVAFIVVGLMANVLSRSITHPVKQLCTIMQSVDKNNFDITAEIDATDEIRQLSDEFNIMLSKIRDLIDQIHHEQELKRKSELKALQAQINPHFLYNTLDSIIWMSEMGNNQEVVLMTSALARLFRISISRGREVITVKDELLHVESYLTIQKMRYREHFSYSIDVDESILTAPCLKILLQPLVENSIYHGLKHVSYQGHISIRGKRQQGSVVLQVADNGAGMDPQTFNHMLSEEFVGTDVARSGVGLRNVHERLKLYFGESYGLSCSRGEQEETVVSVVLPEHARVDEEEI